MTARIRYRQPEQPCTVTPRVRTHSARRPRLRSAPSRAVRPSCFMTGHGARRRHDRLNRDFWKGGAAMSVTLYLAIPCYNEEAVLPETARRLRETTVLRAAGTIGPMSRICRTTVRRTPPAAHFRSARAGSGLSGIRLSRNRGHQNALLRSVDACAIAPTASSPWMPICRTTLMPSTPCSRLSERE